MPIRRDFESTAILFRASTAVGSDMKHARLRAALTFFGILLSGSIASAQPSPLVAEAANAVEGTLYTVGHRESVDGRLNGCGLEFGALKRDFATKQGQPIYLIGSFYIRPHPTASIAYLLKAGIFDLNHNGKGTPPANAFVRAPRGDAPKKGLRIASENPSFAMFTGGVSEEIVEVLSSISENKIMVVGFNRMQGQQDVAVELDLTVVDIKMGPNGPTRQRSDKPVDDFMACVGDLLKRVK